MVSSWISHLFLLLLPPRVIFGEWKRMLLLSSTLAMFCIFGNFWQFPPMCVVGTHVIQGVWLCSAPNLVFGLAFLSSCERHCFYWEENQWSVRNINCVCMSRSLSAKKPWEITEPWNTLQNWQRGGSTWKYLHRSGSPIPMSWESWLLILWNQKCWTKKPKSA